MKKRKSFMLFFLMFFGFAFLAFSQELKYDFKKRDSGPDAWLNLGMGPHAFNISASVKTGKNILSLRYSLIFDVDDYDDTFINEVGILKGYAIRGRSILLSGGIGIGLIYGSLSYNSNSKYRLGIPIETQMFLRISHSFGIGLYGIFNINTEKLMGHLCLSIQIGKLY